MGDVKACAKTIRTMEDDRSKLYAYILSKLSRESMDEYKHHTDYDLVRESLTPLGLWIILKEIHSLSPRTQRTGSHSKIQISVIVSIKLTNFLHIVHS